MELALIAAGLAAAYLFFRGNAPPAPPTSTIPAPGLLTPELQAAGYTLDANGQLRKPAKDGGRLVLTSVPTFSGAGSIVSGGYQTAPYNSSWAGVPPPSNALVESVMRGKGGGLMPGDPSSSIANAVAASAAMLASTISSPPVPAPPPIQRGGIAGTVGTGGLPLGGPLRTGLSSGTGTTVVGTTRLQLLPLTSFVR